MLEKSIRVMSSLAQSLVPDMICIATKLDDDYWNAMASDNGLGHQTKFRNEIRKNVDIISVAHIVVENISNHTQLISVSNTIDNEIFTKTFTEMAIW